MNHIFGNKRLDNIIKLVFFLIIFFLISPNLIFSQTNEQKKRKPPEPKAYYEVKDDDYIPVSRDEQGRSPAYNYIMSNITTVQVNVDGNGLDIVGDAANEPSIAVDPNDRNRMAIGWRQFDTISSNFRQAGYGFTTNGGQTWTGPGVIEPGIFRSDPVLDYDIDGNFYYNSLGGAPSFSCYVFKSNDGGSTWDGGTFAQGGDKQWMTIDKTDGPGTGHNYSFWDSRFSVCDPDFFTRSTNGGESFEDCVSIPNNPRWGTLTVNADGELYVGGTIGIGSDFLVAKSTNAQDSSQLVAWEMATVVDLDGSVTWGGVPNPHGLLGQTWIAVDTSGGTYNGNVYLLCSVERYSNPDPADVMFARSTNGGVNWSTPIKINDDPGTTAYQWFGTMSVAPTGRIDVIWLDTRVNSASYISALYYSNSTDGGATWSANEVRSDYFDSGLGYPNQNKMGDYFDMVSDSSGAHLAWAATFTGGQDVYYSYITWTPDTSTFQLSVNIANGWNMVSVPGTNPAGMDVDTWWSGKDPAAGVFKYAGGYVGITTTTPTEGYWMKNSGAQVYNYPAIEIVPHNDVTLALGWNLIGLYEVTEPTATLQTSPPGIITTPIFEYSGGYTAATDIVPGYGYWAKADAVGSIVNLSAPPLVKAGGEVVEFFPEDWGKIILTDASGINYTLYAVTGEVDLDKYELPPMPPAGMFDIRYGSGRIAEDINNSIQEIQMSGVTYPLTVRVEGMDMRLMDETGRTVNVNLKSGEDVVISDATIQKLMVTGELIPAVYALEQNYPNPFNPLTIIKYSISKTSTVEIKVFDIIGNEIESLVNEEKPAGIYEAEFNATRFASGIYFYQLNAGDFIQTKKMILLR